MTKKGTLGFIQNTGTKENGGIIVASDDPNEIKKQLEEALELAQSQEGSGRKEFDLDVIKSMLARAENGSEVFEVLEKLEQLLRLGKEAQKKPIGFEIPKKI
ncbi:MAG TPA: hypothetical protein VI819_05445 [Patescibacteria group bacterium]|nr:hypothetical protein [Patescibacteria group bacterium]